MTEEEEGRGIPSSVGYFQLFKYSNMSDKLLILLGCIVSMIAGLAIPLLNINLGHMMDIFIQFDDLSSFHQNLLRQPHNYTILNFGLEGDLVEQQVTRYSEIPEEVRDFSERSYMIAFNIVAIGFVYFLLCYFFTVILDKVSATIVYRTKLKFYESLLMHDVTWYDQSFVLAYSSQMEDKFKAMEEGMGQITGFFLYMVSTSVVSLLTAVYYGWELTFVLLALTPAFAILFSIVNRSHRNREEKAIRDKIAANCVAREIISKINLIISYGGEVKQIIRLDRKLAQFVRSEISCKIIQSIGYGLVWFSNYLTYAVGVWYGSKLIIVSRETGTHDYTVGRIIIVFWNVLSITYFAGRTGSFLNVFQSAMRAAGEIFHLIQRESYSHASGIRPNQFTASLQFRGVSLNHMMQLPADSTNKKDSSSSSKSDIQRDDGTSCDQRRCSSRKSLKNVSLTIREGETVAVVGRPGSGKSLIPKLLTRIIEPQDGEIFVGDIEIHDLNLQWLRSNIGYVGTDPFVLDGTIHDNIWLGNRSCVKSDIEEAARIANLDSFVDEISVEKYDTVVGSKGVPLTPGQKQRISIAKVLVKKPKILIFDQVTANVPSGEIDDVSIAIERSRLKTTTLIVSERIGSNVKNADVIVVMEKGRIVEQGTHDQLMERKGAYRVMLAQQSITEMNVNNRLYHHTDDDDVSRDDSEEEESDDEGEDGCETQQGSERRSHGLESKKKKKKKKTGGRKTQHPAGDRVSDEGNRGREDDAGKSESDGNEKKAKEEGSMDQVCEKKERKIPVKGREFKPELMKKQWLEQHQHQQQTQPTSGDWNSGRERAIDVPVKGSGEDDPVKRSSTGGKLDSSAELASSSITDPSSITASSAGSSFTEDNNNNNIDDDIKYKKYDEDRKGWTTKLSSPTPRFTHKYSLKRIATFMERDVAFVILGCICSAIFGLGVPLYAVIVGEFMIVLESHDHDDILDGTKVIAAAFVGLSLLVSIATSLSSSFFAIASCKLSQRLKSQTLRSLLTQDMEWITRGERKGKCQKDDDDFEDEEDAGRDRLGKLLCDDIESVSNILVQRTGSYAQTAGTVTACVAYSLHLDWRMGLVAITLMPFIMYRFKIMGGSLVGSSNKSSNSNKRKNDKKKEGGKNKNASELIRTSRKLMDSVRTSSCLQHQTQFCPMFKKILLEDLQRRESQLHMRGQALAVIQCIPVLSYGIVFMFGSHYVMDDSIHYADFYKIVEGVIFGSILISEGALFSPEDMLPDLKDRIGYLFHVIDSKRYAESNGFGSIPDGCDGMIHFSQVDYRSNNSSATSEHLLRSFDLEVRRGSSVAILGQDDGTKESIGCLLQKIFHPSAGIIFLDGHDITGINTPWLRSKIAVIRSDPQILCVTVGENIAFGDNNRYVAFEEVISAAEAAGIHQFIQSLPLGYDTIVCSSDECEEREEEWMESCAASGSVGRTSGGTSGIVPLDLEQKLRISFARAFLRNPVILLLEHIDSGFDHMSMIRIQETLDRLKKGRTVICIPDNWNCNHTYDHIVLTQDATVRLEGSHQDLMSHSQYYFDLYKLY